MKMIEDILLGIRRLRAHVTPMVLAGARTIFYFRPPVGHSICSASHKKGLRKKIPAKP